MEKEELAKIAEIVADKVGPATRMTCAEHSGLTVWIKVGCGLLSVLLLVFSWSTFVVAPEVKTALEKQTAANDKRFYAVERDISDIKVIETRIIAQRNADHSRLQKLQ
jgi:hypothetical protein